MFNPKSSMSVELITVISKLNIPDTDEMSYYSYENQNTFETEQRSCYNQVFSEIWMRQLHKIRKKLIISRQILPLVCFINTFTSSNNRNHRQSIKDVVCSNKNTRHFNQQNHPI